MGAFKIFSKSYRLSDVVQEGITMQRYNVACAIVDDTGSKRLHAQLWTTPEVKGCMPVMRLSNQNK
jgi:hypothetical protein